MREFMACVGKFQSLGDMVDALQIPCRTLGVHHLICVSAFGFSALQDRKVMFAYLDNDWIRHYNKNKYYIDDALPIGALALKDWGEPFWWSDFLCRKDLTKLQVKIFREAFDFGLKEGLVVPIPVSADDENQITEYAYVSMGGDIVKSDELENALRLMVTAAHGTARRIYLRKARESKTGLVEDVTGISRNIDFSGLTARQKEVLIWICEGEKPVEVADRLGVTAGVINDHIKTVKRKYYFSSTGELVKALHRHRVFL